MRPCSIGPEMRTRGVNESNPSMPLWNRKRGMKFCTWKSRLSCPGRITMLVTPPVALPYAAE